MPKHSFIVFILIVLSVYTFLHFFFFYNIIKGLKPGTAVKYILLTVMILLGFTLIIAEISGHHYPLPLLFRIGFIWLGILSIAFTVFLFHNILNFIFHFDRALSTRISLLLILFMSGYSIWNASRPPQLKEIILKFPKLPVKASGFTIIQLSDIHIDLITPTQWPEMMSRMVNEQNPDLIVITGDVADIDICTNSKFCNAFKKLKAKYGKYAVSGNHEYYTGYPLFRKFCQQAGITILENQSQAITDSLILAGIPDKASGQFGMEKPDLDKALLKTDRKKLNILLNHQPLQFKKAVSKGVDLQLSGHIHAGQLPPIDILAFFIFRYYYGLYSCGSSYIYTTSGTRLWGPPMRFLNHSEIVKIILTK